MASRYPDRIEIAFDATSCTVADEEGEIDGVLRIEYGTGSTERGRVRAQGSRSPIDYVRGSFTPPDGRLTMYRRQAGAWVKRIKDANPGAPVTEVPKSFTVTYALYDEEGFALPAQVDTFTALIDPPRGLGADQGRPNEALTVEIPLFVLGKVKFNGVEID